LNAYGATLRGIGLHKKKKKKKEEKEKEEEEEKKNAVVNAGDHSRGHISDP